MIGAEQLMHATTYVLRQLWRRQRNIYGMGKCDMACPASRDPPMRCARTSMKSVEVGDWRTGIKVGDGSDSERYDRE